MKIKLGDGWGDVDAAFGDLIKTLEGDALYEVLEAGAVVVVERALELVPVDTGELKESIHIEREGDVPLVGASAEHAEPVEYGTSHMDAQPYLRPAMDDHQPVMDAISQKLSEKQEGAKRT